MQTGWAQVNGAWYYLNNEGKMQTGWQEIEGRRYFLDASGVMKTGWQDIDGAWYYFQCVRSYEDRLAESGRSLVLSERQKERCRPAGRM